MAAGLVLEFQGVGKILYDTVNAKLGIDMETGTGDWPPGLLSHAAGPTDDGLVVIEVWESQDAQGKFMETRLGSALRDAGVTESPRILWTELFAYHTP